MPAGNEGNEGNRRQQPPVRCFPTVVAGQLCPGLIGGSSPQSGVPSMSWEQGGRGDSRAQTGHVASLLALPFLISAIARNRRRRWTRGAVRFRLDKLFTGSGRLFHFAAGEPMRC